MKYLCNPLNIEYRYQFHEANGSVNREAADPSMICFQGKYYIFASMTLGVLVSEDMAEWSYHRLPDILPLYDYAPDARVVGDYVYICASAKSHSCSFFRTKDILNGPYEKIQGTFPFWDPNLFLDEDGRVYFYWGCSNTEPIFGVELDLEQMKPIGKAVSLISGCPEVFGYERVGEDHVPLMTQKQIEVQVQEKIEQMESISPKMLKRLAQYLGLSDSYKNDDLKEQIRARLIQKMGNDPYIEGAWMTKHNGTYYLQYACPGTQYNIYGDGVYVSDNPLGSFTPAKNNPYSYCPGGFMPGAGHGSTMEDLNGNWWHTATMRISRNHAFERRIGIWPAGFDADGELFCNQRYGDWPRAIEQAKANPWAEPEWYLLSYRKSSEASSMEKGKESECAFDENCQTWWRAATAAGNEWLKVDLDSICEMHAVQVNFADDKINIPLPAGASYQGEKSQSRYIAEQKLVTRWKLEGSADGEAYTLIADRSDAETNLPHELIISEKGLKFRYIKLTVSETPYNQPACVSGLRIFGKGNGKKPKQPAEVRAEFTGDLDLSVHWKKDDAIGHNILWGYAPEKLYHSYLVMGNAEQQIGAIVKGQPLFLRVDAVNENGITHGNLMEVNIKSK